MSENVPSISDLERQIAGLEANFDSFRKAQTAGRRRSLLFPSLLGAMVLAFGVATYTRIQENFTDTEMRAAMARHTDDLRPMLQTQAMAALDELTPVYKAELLKTLDRVGPEVGARTIEKIRALPDELAPMAQKRTEAMVQRVFDRLRPELEKAIGRVPQDRERELVADAVRQISEDVKHRGELVAKSQTDRVEELLHAFDLPAATPSGKLEDHQRQFVHLLLLLADHELMADESEISTPPAAQRKSVPAAVGLVIPH